MAMTYPQWTLFSCPPRYFCSRTAFVISSWHRQSSTTLQIVVLEVIVKLSAIVSGKLSS